MTVVAFDAATARKAGNTISIEAGDKVLRDAGGVELARISKKAAPGLIAPLNQVTGSCGSSFFYLYDMAGATYALRTGFSVTSSAYDFDWQTRVYGQSGNEFDDWEWSDSGPMWPSTSWTSGYVTNTQQTPAGTYCWGRVIYGQAYLVNGAICTSGYPSDAKWLYK